VVENRYERTYIKRYIPLVKWYQKNDLNERGSNRAIYPNHEMDVCWKQGDERSNRGARKNLSRGEKIAAGRFCPTSLLWGDNVVSDERRLEASRRFQRED